VSGKTFFRRWTNPSFLPYSTFVQENHTDDDTTSRTTWHPAFVEALMLELQDYMDVLDFHPEYNLTSEPLRIDCVVIKKAKGAVIEKNIAAIFRGVNLVEYKSPTDYLSIDDFYKVYAYACLYVSFQKTPATDITISFVESHRPDKLIAHLEKERGYTVVENGQGIYTVIGDIFPIQVIDNRYLPEDENLWLKNLSNALDMLAVQRIGDAAERQGKGAKLRAYLAAIIKANPLAIQEAMNMETLHPVLEKAFIEHGYVAKWKAEAEERKSRNIAQNMIVKGYPFEDIVSLTELDPEKVRELYAPDNGSAMLTFLEESGV